MDFEHLRGRRVFVTGGTGFVGRHLLPRLVEAGAEVSCLVRPTSRRDMLPADVRPVQADLHSGEGLSAALAGQDMCVHMAALLFGTSWQEYLRANILAARILGRSIAQSDVQRCLLLSSLAAAGPSGHAPGKTEAEPPAPVSAYGWSKLVGEEAMGRLLGERLVIVRPPIIYGSGDKGLLPCFQGAARGLAVTPGLLREFPVSVVHVHDVAQAICRALSPEARGTYHINDGAEHTMTSFSRAMGKALGRNVRVAHLPLPLMAVTAAISGFFGRWAKRPPSWNYDKYRESSAVGWLCDCSRIRQDLAYVPHVSLESGMAEAVEGYRREGWLS